MNVMQLIQMIQQGGNPQAMILNMLQPMGNNPMIANLIQMAQRKDGQGIVNFARNMMKERGVDFDAAFANFRNQFHI